MVEDFSCICTHLGCYSLHSVSSQSFNLLLLTVISLALCRGLFEEFIVIDTIVKFFFV